MTRLTTNQKHLLDAVTRADEQYRKEKAEAFERHNRLAEQEVEASRIRRDIAAYQAFEGGVRVTGSNGLAQKEAGLHTTAAKTAYDAIESGRRFAAAPAVVADGEAFDFDPETGVLTVDGVEFVVRKNLAGKRVLEPTVDAEPDAPAVFASGRDALALAWLDAQGVAA
ncbi:hypothetical protein [Agromyces larvae]|uniref:Uncharacterized protein n=1 Tax=Agromyces larvae TaxID=2929802 RepID=A0ABY4C3J9_9MICO|nr:hypothetical protein [Agromyces larvae]UOE45933.1 hypothetical protein MTO99_09390 [Agromyces larvae]